MPSTERVELIGGPLDGEHRHVRHGARIVTWEFPSGVLLRSYGSSHVVVQQVEIATYRLQLDGRWVYVP